MSLGDFRFWLFSIWSLKVQINYRKSWFHHPKLSGSGHYCHQPCLCPPFQVRPCVGFFEVSASASRSTCAINYASGVWQCLGRVSCTAKQLGFSSAFRTTPEMGEGWRLWCFLPFQIRSYMDFSICLGCALILDVPVCPNWWKGWRLSCKCPSPVKRIRTHQEFHLLRPILLILIF